MRKPTLLFHILAVLALLSFALPFSISKGAYSQITQIKNGPYNPVPLKDLAVAIAVGRRVATSELTQDARPDQVRFISVRRVSAAGYSQEMAVDGIGGNSLQRLTGNIWVVTFSGLFTPKRTPPNEYGKRIYTTCIVYLSADTGSVLGVSMNK